MTPNRSTDAHGRAVTSRGGTDEGVGDRQHFGDHPVMVQT